MIPFSFVWHIYQGIITFKKKNYKNSLCFHLLILDFAYEMNYEILKTDRTGPACSHETYDVETLNVWTGEIEYCHQWYVHDQ